MAQKLHIYQGATFSHLCTINRNDDGASMDLTGATIKSELRAKGDALVAAFTIEDVDLVNGQFRLTLTDEETAAMDEGRSIFDILIEWTDGTAHRSPAVQAITHKKITE